MTRFRDLLSTLVSAAALLFLIAASIVMIRVAFRSAPSSRVADAPPERLSSDDWSNLVAGGNRLGSEHSAPEIAVFSDFECPSCRHFALDVIPRIRRAHPEIAIAFHHWPLPQHKNAYIMARASLCAAAQGRFQRYHDLLFESKDSISHLELARIAQEAGVANLKEFRRCAASTQAVSAIDSDSAFARRIGSKGTPTVIVGGWRLMNSPDSAALEAALQMGRGSQR